MMRELELLSEAVGVLTAWTDINGGRRDYRALNAVLDGLDDAGRDDLIRGLISLAGGLLCIRQAETGMTPLQTLQAIARDIADGGEERAQAAGR